MAIQHCVCYLKTVNHETVNVKRNPMSPKMWEYVIRKCPALKANCCNHVYTFFIKKMFQTYKNSAYDEFTGSECITKDTHKKFI